MVETQGSDQAHANPETYVPLTALKHAIVHSMVVQGSKASVDAREDELPKTALAQRLVDTLYSVYRSRHAKSHGKFNGDEEKAPSQKHAKAYLLDQEGDFCAFTKRMAELLCDKVQGKAATSGHVFFAHIEGDGREFLLIAIVTDEVDIALSRQKDLRESEHLDLKGFRFAGRIDVTGWREQSDRYVSFLKGTKDVSNYFMAFLGCDTAIPNLADTQHLTNAIRGFASTATINGAPLSEEERDQFFWRVDAHCRKMADNSEPLDTEAFCNELWPKEPAALQRAIVESDYPFSDGFVVNKRGLQGLVHFRGKGDHWELKFDREALSKGNVHYNAEDQTITLRGVPVDLIARLKHEDEDREE
ncbi:nucleoid-associated protein [Lysobacter sp. A286]